MAKYWFRQKSIGFGATPNTWQGWALTLGYAVVLIFMVSEAKQISDRHTQMLVIMSGVALLTIAFCVVCYLKTEGGWRWRSGREEN
jgi:amino acid permease